MSPGSSRLPPNWILKVDLFPRRDKPNQVRFRAMMESGELIDEQADIVQTQVIAHRARASIRNRDAVPLYMQTEEGRPPVWRENLIVETGYAQPPGSDSRYVLEDSQNLLTGIRSGAVDIDPESKVRANIVQIIANIAGALIFCGALWYAGLSLQAQDAPRAVEESAVVEQVGANEAEQAEERVIHGFMDSIEPGEASAPGEEAGGSGMGPGTGEEAGGTGDGAEGSLERGPVGVDATDKSTVP